MFYYDTEEKIPEIRTLDNSLIIGKQLINMIFISIKYIPCLNNFFFCFYFLTDLFEKSVFNFLENESKLKNGSNERFHDNVMTSTSRSIARGKSLDSFIIKHFICNVEYSTVRFFDYISNYVRT